MSSLPFDEMGAAGAADDEEGRCEASAVGRVLAGAGTGADWRCVALGVAPWTGGWLAGDVAARFGSEPRPGGGGGFDAAGAGGCETDAARIDADADGVAGGADGRGGGADGRPEGGAAGWMAGSDDWLGVDCAGPGIPMRVFFSSAPGFAATCAPDPGGGGGTADVLPDAGPFLPRPSKMSRSEPPFLSSDIRVS
jgi:hypothetical protein